MENKIMIGKLTSRKRIIIELLTTIPFLYIFRKMMYSMFEKSAFYLNYPDMLDVTINFILIFIVLAMIISLSSYGNKQIIVVDQKNFKYCSNQNIFSRYQQFYRIIKNKEQFFDIQIPLENIVEITLSYSDIYMLWNQKGHAIIFNLKLTDDTLIRINPDNLYFKKENCLKGIEFIESHGVLVKDPYHLKEALQNNEMRFAEYIEKVRKENGL